ncbi:MAG TPA: Maf family protein [Gammaproteobacteria bacterium]|nr:Maf family protein [Gammaproteobacteria bacterium]
MSDNSTRTLILASSSPRRKALLEQLGIRCEVRPVDIDESVREGETPRGYVERLALEKARAARTDDGAVVLGADTAVVVDDDILGKPRDFAHAREMLKRLADREHEVLTAVAVVAGAHEEVVTTTSRVVFGPLADETIEAYWATGEPADKAGAYAVQGIAGAFVRELHGSVTGVIGLPLYETVELLHRFGIHALSR